MNYAQGQIADVIEDEAEEQGSASRCKDAIQLVVDGVVYGIRSGQMVPGQHLVEADLARRFAVSRGSLREGLKQLASEGIVSLTRFRGAFIAAMDRKGVSDLLEVLEPLCSLGARLAAENCRSDADKARLMEIAQRLGREANDRARAAYLEDRRLFYDHLIAMGGNSELGHVIPLARTDLFRAQFETVQSKDQRKKHANGYARIAEAVGANDPARAVRAVRKHFQQTHATLDVLPDQLFVAANS